MGYEIEDVGYDNNLYQNGERVSTSSESYFDSDEDAKEKFIKTQYSHKKIKIIYTKVCTVEQFFGSVTVVTVVAVVAVVAVTVINSLNKQLF